MKTGNSLWEEAQAEIEERLGKEGLQWVSKLQTNYELIRNQWFYLQWFRESYIFTYKRVYTLIWKGDL